MKKWLLSLPLCLLVATATSCAQIDKIVKEYEAKKEATQAENDQIRNADLDNPVASLSVEQISNEFESNSVLAEDKYMNKPVEISGYIGSIDDSMFGDDKVGVQITSGGEFSMASVACSVPRKSPIVAQFKKGDRVAVRGVITSEEMGIGMSRCKFYDYKSEQWIGGSAATRTSIASAKNTEIIASNQKSEVQELGDRKQSGTCQFNDGSVPCIVSSDRNGISMIWSDGVTENYTYTPDGNLVDTRGGLWIYRSTSSGFQIRHNNGNMITFTPT